MKKIISSLLFILLIISVYSFSVLKYTETNKLTIHFENFVGNKLLRLDTMIYKNEFKQDYSVSKFKYYIGDIHLRQKNGRDFVSDKYFLVNEDEPSSKTFTLEGVPSGDYSGISFIVGVDSLHNCSGVQQGSLDPVNGMFWAWNTGYVFLKLEGKSPASKSPGNMMEFHIGGYRHPYNCIRTITLNLEKYNLNVAGGINISISIKTDISEMFRSPSSIDFSKISSVSDFHNSTLIADNYSDMFSIESAELK